MLESDKHRNIALKLAQFTVSCAVIDATTLDLPPSLKGLPVGVARLMQTEESGIGESRGSAVSSANRERV